MQKTGMEVGFGKKSQRPVILLLIGYVKKTEEFEFVDKAFFALFSSLGYGAEPANILTEQGDDHIRLALLQTI
jgi:hypothetical protein